MWEEDEVIPTYTIGDPDLNPMFFSGRAYQGAKGRVYPYPLLEKLSNEKLERKHTIVYLENEYIKMGVIPGPGGGGRLHFAQDKTNDYELFYHQHVLKPGLIGVLGAWWSGGIEWNFPHHHRTSNFLPLDYSLEEHPDGSKTVWLGEIETRHRMKWMVGLTLKPGKSQVEMTARLYNRTPMTQTFLFWANVAVHVDETYQFIFPPSQAWTTGHGKHTFGRWPLATGEPMLRGRVFEKGTDLSWWKAHESSISIFSIFSEEDFFAGYDHGKRAGVLHVADHHVVPGKKMWSWGTNESAKIWDSILTDSDGPYIELMVGAYQDNQPDYSWLQPYEVKEFKQTWYPLRELGGVKNANLEAAVNLEVSEEGKVRFAFNTSGKYHGARALLITSEKTLFEETINICPAHPFVKEIPLPGGVSEEDLQVSLISSAGDELIRYQKQSLPEQPQPEAVKPPLAPEEIETIEELYLAGSRLLQFHSAALSPEPYFEEALRRDPGDFRCNTALGLLFLRRGMFQEAEERFEQALARVEKNHTIPRDGEAYYYLGLAQRYLGKDEAAYKSLYRATWSSAWKSAAYYSLAELACRKGNHAKALEFLDRSLFSGYLNNKAWNLKAAILRKMGRPEEASQIAVDVLSRDRLDHWAANELYLAALASGKDRKAASLLADFDKIMRGSFQNYLELAMDYYGCGLYEEEASVLERMIALPETRDVAVTLSGRSLTDGSKAMAYYYLGHCHELSGETEEALEFYKRAASMSTDLVFPFRLEAYTALNAAIRANSADAVARYYLGNLMFQSQPEKAVEQWEAARRLDDTFAIVHRNLGLAYARIQNDIDKAISSLELAVKHNSKDPRLHLELDRLYESGKVSAQQRLKLMEAHQGVVNRSDDLAARQAALYVRVGDYEKAIEILESRHFHVWEGGGAIHGVFVDAHLARGQDRLRAQDYKAAEMDFKRALDYPINLQVGRPSSGGRAPEIHYFLGKVSGLQGYTEKAEEHYARSVAETEGSRWTSRRYPGLLYFKALSYRELGDEEAANRLLDQLIEVAEKGLQQSSGDRFFAKFGEQQSDELRRGNFHYLRGLGYLGKGDKMAARVEFEKTLELDINHVWAARFLSTLAN
jgi:tetratricopeptide (TPR) repeat protein